MIFGSKLYRARVIRNSLAWARQHLDDAPDGSIFLADTLEEAQGRQGRTWQIDKGQLLITALLKPGSIAQICPENLSIRLNQLSMALSLGILEPLKQWHAGIKWPNDFVIADKKVGGMLMQTVWQDGHVKAIILGFAINANNIFLQEDQLHTTATSLCMAAGAPVVMKDVYHQLLKTLDHFYTLWRDEKFDEIYKKWRQEQVYLQQPIHVHQKDGSKISGVLTQVLPNGDAMIKADAGKIMIVQFHNVETVSG
jgi:BirA family biotin operon repressor/biotin-[acetyl-CoA-carboxylase] ligase